MSDTNAPRVLLAINSTEWLNLCARGSIRMSKRRPTKVSIPVTNHAMERVFASAPFTKMESSVDLFILQISHQWPETKDRHNAFPSEIFALNLSDVLTHHPIAREHFDYYQNIAKSVEIDLEPPIFEEAWTSWTLKETLHESREAAKHLQKALNISPSSDIKKFKNYTWEEISQLVLRPHHIIKQKPGHIEVLLRNVRNIADDVTEARNSEKFYIACAIEWIVVVTGKDPFKKKTAKDLLMQALNAAGERALGSPSDQTIKALEFLTTSFPKAFKDPISPLLVANLVQLLTESRTKKLNIETVRSIFSSQDEQSESATFLSFTLATSLGIELTLQLVRALHQVNPRNIDWDVLS